MMGIWVSDAGMLGIYVRLRSMSMGWGDMGVCGLMGGLDMVAMDDL